MHDRSLLSVGVTAFDLATGTVEFRGDLGCTPPGTCATDDQFVLSAFQGLLAHDATVGNYADLTDIDPGPGNVSIPLAGLTMIKVLLGDGDDVLIIDSNGGFIGNSIGLTIQFDGGPSKTTAGDSLKLTGVSGPSFAQDLVFGAAPGAGTIVTGDGVASQSVQFSGLEPIFDDLALTNRTFVFTGASESITLGDDLDPTNGRSLIASSSGGTVIFANPTGSLTIDAGAGNDTVVLQPMDSLYAMSVTVRGGDGDDAIDAANYVPPAPPPNASQNNPPGRPATGAPPSVAAGFGSPVVLVLDGGGGNDSLLGSPAPDSLIGADGDDRLEGGAASDTLSGDLGNDLLVGGPGNDLLDGGAGANDTVDFSKSGNGVKVNLASLAPWATGEGKDALIALENVIGSAFANKIIGDKFANIIVGTGGPDFIRGGGGNDSIDAGPGNDIVLGGDGDDTIKGEDGKDRLFGEAGADQLFGLTGHDVLCGGLGDDFLDGGDGNDSIAGGQGTDMMFGGLGFDLICFDNLDSLVSVGGGGPADKLDGGRAIQC